jgi:hypothetical protein
MLGAIIGDITVVVMDAIPHDEVTENILKEEEIR